MLEGRREEQEEEEDMERELVHTVGKIRYKIWLQKKEKKQEREEEETPLYASSDEVFEKKPSSPTIVTRLYIHAQSSTFKRWSACVEDECVITERERRGKGERDRDVLCVNVEEIYRMMEDAVHTRNRDVSVAFPEDSITDHLTIEVKLHLNYIGVKMFEIKLAGEHVTDVNRMEMMVENLETQNRFLHNKVNALHGQVGSLQQQLLMLQLEVKEMKLIGGERKRAGTPVPANLFPNNIPFAVNPITPRATAGSHSANRTPTTPSKPIPARPWEVYTAYNAVPATETEATAHTHENNILSKLIENIQPSPIAADMNVHTPVQQPPSSHTPLQRMQQLHTIQESITPVTPPAHSNSVPHAHAHLHTHAHPHAHPHGLGHQGKHLWESAADIFAECAPLWDVGSHLNASSSPPQSSNSNINNSNSSINSNNNNSNNNNNNHDINSSTANLKNAWGANWNMQWSDDSIQSNF